MPRQWMPLMTRLLLARRVEEELQALHSRDAAIDAAAREAADEARARRDLRLEHLGFPLKTKKER